MIGGNAENQIKVKVKISKIKLAIQSNCQGTSINPLNQIADTIIDTGYRE